MMGIKKTTDLNHPPSSHPQLCSGSDFCDYFTIQSVATKLGGKGILWQLVVGISALEIGKMITFMLEG